jgi:MinD-like ATPase involved in chromosome partitioning or flagellar assembly
VTDDQRPPDDELESDRSARRLRSAQAAAGDLARMGIDPRSLGLDESAPEPLIEEPASDGVETEGASVVQLRPSTTPDAAAGRAPTQHALPPAVEEREEATRRASRVEQLLSRAHADQPVSRETSRLFRTVARGLVTVDAAVSAQGERELLDAVRSRQGDRRTVAFVSGQGGVGCTTMAVATGTTFMALRDDRSVVVDVRSGTPSLGQLYGATAPLGVTALLGRAELASAPTNASGLGLVDGAGWDQPLSRTDVAEVLDRLGEEHLFRLFDAGNDAGEASRTALARADQVVVVTGPGRSGSSAAGLALDRVGYVNPACVDSVVHVVVCPHEESYRESLRQVGDASQQPGGPIAVVVVPPDPHLARGLPFDPERVSASLRGAVLRVAAAVAVGGRGR